MIRRPPRFPLFPYTPFFRSDPPLDPRLLRGKEAVAKAVHVDRGAAHALEEEAPARLGLAAALLVAAEHDPAHAQRRALGDQAQNGAAAANLDVVGMRAEAEQPERRVARREGEAEHARLSRWRGPARARPGRAPRSWPRREADGSPRAARSVRCATAPRAAGPWHRAPPAPADP